MVINKSLFKKITLFCLLLGLSFVKSTNSYGSENAKMLLTEEGQEIVFMGFGLEAVPIRNEASFRGDSLMLLPEGSFVKGILYQTEEGEGQPAQEWVKIKYLNAEGFVPRNFLEEAQDASEKSTSPRIHDLSGLFKETVMRRTVKKQTLLDHILDSAEEIKTRIIEEREREEKEAEEKALLLAKEELTEIEKETESSFSSNALIVEEKENFYTIQMEATAYTADGTLTASGTVPARGTIAVDPKLIPLGTRLYIEGYGQGIALDTGGVIKGNIIDLYMDSKEEVYRWGRRQVSVRIYTE